MRRRTQSGVSIVEFAAVISIGLPLLILLIYAAMETSFAFMITSNLDVAARKAARDLAIEYTKDPTIATNSGLQQAVFDKIRIPNFVAANSQFGQPVFTTTTPQKVTVTVSYPSGGGNGLPTFPNPDPLGLGAQFKLQSTATASLI
jgi:Flp pilus assembly protein TadG